MRSENAPFHAHVYYRKETRELAESLHRRLRNAMDVDGSSGLLHVGQMIDFKVGPHPEPQFEIHFVKGSLPEILPFLESVGLTILIHPLTDNDHADHTDHAHWIGQPLPLDLTTLDPPGVNQGLARFGKKDF
ncbi:DOPA 4,5-dioxygenase family protein [Undibacterium sp.]|jgi:aromatic ring-cleaving dioxygenase|uniref:DOPA 4,5-dioxygenase family protein n=1 Tax=Undibacterium sp. TaxID=1914977 RepID=UPI002C23DDE9|nr:DOPA 4,5-dioxygenase family protein [Undibacterium sp.]HTD04429.1 DOPA 4,5-dioxygenase family protein [Undibacterium sp.]